MKIYVVGNPLLSEDSIPLKLLPKLRKAFPREHFEEADPNENFIPEEGSIIIDTIQGIDNVRWFDNLAVFQTTNSVSPHDYDLGFHLLLLFKLKKIRAVRILGIPGGMTKEKALKQVTMALDDFFYFQIKNTNARREATEITTTEIMPNRR